MLQMIALSIFNICMSNEIDIHTVWIPRIENQRADFLSRIIDINDWGTTVNFFQLLDSLWGPHTVDRFANMNNTKLLRLNSLYWNPGSIAVDAFTSDWSGENNWLVPPVSMVSRLINHLIKSNSVGTSVVPKCPSSSFWLLLFHTGLIYKQYVTDVLEFSETDRILQPGNNVNSLFASNILAVRLDASVY